MDVNMSIIIKNPDGIFAILREMSGEDCKIAIDVVESTIYIKDANKDQIEKAMKVIKRYFHVLKIETNIKMKELGEEEDVSGINIRQFSAHEYLTYELWDALSVVDREKGLEKSVEEFMDMIGMPKEDKILRTAFVAACRINSGFVEYSEIFKKMIQIIGYRDEDSTVEHIKEELEVWLNKNPKIRENFPTMKSVALFKAFARKWRNSKVK